MRRGGGTKRERERGRHTERIRGRGQGEIKMQERIDRLKIMSIQLGKKKNKGRHYAKITDGIE